MGKGVGCIHSGILLSNNNKNEILPPVATWMDPEGVRLSQISLTERQTPYDFTHTENLKTKQMNKHNKMETEL